MWSTEAVFPVTAGDLTDKTTPKSISFISEGDQLSPHKSEELPNET